MADPDGVDREPDPLPGELESRISPGDVLVIGYLGRGEDADTRRISADPDMREYIEVPTHLIHWRRRLDPDSVVSPSAIWLDGEYMREPLGAVNELPDVDDFILTMPGGIGLGLPRDRLDAAGRITICDMRWLISRFICSYKVMC